MKSHAVSLCKNGGDHAGVSIHLNVDIENRPNMLVSFDIEFIRRDQKQRRNGEACRASPPCFWSSPINLISKERHLRGFLFIRHYKQN